MLQVIQILGALAILIAYGANQFKWLPATSLPYIVLNLIGSAVLAVLALMEEQWGFLLLEGVWALISAWSLVRLLRGHSARASH